MTKVDYIEVIFSEKPEGLHNLVLDGMLGVFINELTPFQKEAVFNIVIKANTVVETAELMGTSETNVRKHYKKALFNIRGKMYRISRFKEKLESDEKYREITESRNLYLTKEERNFIKQSSQEVKKYYEKH